MHPAVPRWLEWARQLQSLSQTGLFYALNDYDRQRYQRLGEIAAQITSAYSTLEEPALLALFKAQTGYATPKVDVRAAVFQEKRLLLVRERSDGGWTMPGGWADVGDAPSQAAEREVREEAGFEVKAHRLIGIYDANRVTPLEFFHAYKIFFLCELVGGSAQSSFETSEVAFFAREEIPAQLSWQRTSLGQIEDAFKAFEDATLPPFFD